MPQTEKAAADSSLARRLADGDPLAPRDLVESHQAELYRYAYAMLRERTSAEDAVHDAFERAFRALGRYSEERLRAMRLRAWLYRITLNVVRNRIRARREVELGEYDDLIPDASGGGSREGVMDAMAALRDLPERQRTAVTLRYLQDLPYREISEATGWPEGTAKTLVRRGVERLRKALIQEESP